MNDCLPQGAGLCLRRRLLFNQWGKNVQKIHFNLDFFGPERWGIMYGIKIKPLLHWCFGIRGDIALPTGHAISLRIPKHQCNNVLVSEPVMQKVSREPLYLIYQKKNCNVTLTKCIGYFLLVPVARLLFVCHQRFQDLFCQDTYLLHQIAIQYSLKIVPNYFTQPEFCCYFHLNPLS